LSLVAAIAKAHNAELKLGLTNPDSSARGLKVMIRFPRIE